MRVAWLRPRTAEYYQSANLRTMNGMVSPDRRRERIAKLEAIEIDWNDPKSLWVAREALESLCYDPRAERMGIDEWRDFVRWLAKGKRILD